MEQKDYNLEIVNVLVSGENHIRGIAKILNINHMMVVRRIKILSEKNIVDFKKNGRNNNYFLKNNPETRSYILILENYKLINIILKYPFFREIVEKIQKDKRIKFACIFGSYSKGLEKKSSDVDIYISSNNLEIKKEYSKLDSKFSIKIGEWDNKNNLIKEIIDNHVLIKGGDFYYEKVFN